MSDYIKKIRVKENGVMVEKQIDYNALANLPTVEQNTLIAHTEEEFNSFIVAENDGKIISYNDKLYMVEVHPATSNPPQAGDTITELYFDTSVTPNLEALNGINGINVYRTGNTGNSFIISNFYSDSIVFWDGADSFVTVYTIRNGWIYDHWSV